MKRPAPPDAAPHAATETEQDEQRPSLLDELARASAAAGAAGAPGGAPLVGECLDDRHPSMDGRYLVRWQRGPEAQEEQRWLPGLKGAVLRPGDRVLLLQPANWAEPLVLGVLGGLAPRPAVEPAPGPQLTLPADEALQVRTAEGAALLEVYQDEAGPVVRLLDEDTRLELPGELRLSARAIALEAREGGVEIEASDDVVVKGERVKLN